MDKAWEIYHESFDDNAQEVIVSLKNTYYQYAANTPVNYVDAMLTLFRDLGETTLANEILKNYIEMLKKRKTTINSDNYPFFDSLKDSELIESLKVLEYENEPELSIEKVLEEILLRKGWSEYHEKFLADCSVEDFYMVFKKTKGKKLSSYIYACLKFGKITPPKENYKKITNSAQLALKQIAKENPLNRARISKFSIHVDD